MTRWLMCTEEWLSEKISVNEKERERIAIRLQTLKYLARGGTVVPVDHTANHSYQQPIKRNRKDQVNYIRRYRSKG